MAVCFISFWFLFVNVRLTWTTIPNIPSNYSSKLILFHKNLIPFPFTHPSLGQCVFSLQPQLPSLLGIWLWKILKEMGIPDHLTCLLRNLYAGQEATVKTGHGTTDWFQIGKGVCQGCILSHCLFNLYAEYIMRNSGLEEKHKLESSCQEKDQ